MLPITLSKLRSSRQSFEDHISIPEFRSANRRSRKVVAIGDGHRAWMEFESISEAAAHFGVAPGAVANSINNGHRASNRRFVFADTLAENIPNGLSKYRKREPVEERQPRSSKYK